MCDHRSAHDHGLAAAERSLPHPRPPSNANVGPRIFMVAPQGPDLKEYALRLP